MSPNRKFKTNKNTIQLKSIHPFPARMATEIAFERLKTSDRKLKVLDPMAGSGTSIAVAVRSGHEAYGFDTDPLAVLMSTVWCSEINLDQVRLIGSQVLETAKKEIKSVRLDKAYPIGCNDPETKKFIKYWFDKRNHKQLYALSIVISRVHDETCRKVLWCAFSKMIIKKKGGVSLAMDVSHSRPHKVVDKSEKGAFDIFIQTLEKLLTALDESSEQKNSAKIQLGDARSLPLEDESIDLVITSPPYLNAIDYLRGHRLSLVWMGYSIPKLREIRSTNIGSERKTENFDRYVLDDIVIEMCSKKKIPSRLKGIIERYVLDLYLMINEINRVLICGGTATFIIGNSSTQGVFVRNSKAIESIASKLGLKLESSSIRKLPANKRYLPPPSANSVGISNRMRTETLLTFSKQRLN